jgi:hypothetical protein
MTVTREYRNHNTSKMSSGSSLQRLQQFRSIEYGCTNFTWAVDRTLFHESRSVFLLHMGFEMFHKSGENLPPLSFRGVILRHPEAA